jgi:hypothetical protein
MPVSFANMGQNVLSNVWIGGFKNGAIQRNKEVETAIFNYLQKSSSNMIVEIAAGGGSASSLWVDLLKSYYDLPYLKLLLTDLQPNLDSWITLQHKYKFVEYANFSVDASDLYTSLSNKHSNSHRNQTMHSLRMINFALHHFQPDLVRSIFADIIRTQSAIIVGDTAPRGGGILWLPILTLKYVLYTPLYQHIMKLPLWFPITVPFLPFMAWHDATISIMRSYSKEELISIVSSIPGSEDYDINYYESGDYATWLGIPGVKMLGLDHPVVHYFLIQPTKIHK